MDEWIIVNLLLASAETQTQFRNGTSSRTFHKVSCLRSMTEPFIGMAGSAFYKLTRYRALSSMAKKRKAMGTVTTTATGTPTGITTFPAVQAGRHPWFYFEDGTIILKVNYSKLQLDNSVHDFVTLADTNHPLQGSPTFSD